MGNSISKTEHVFTGTGIVPISADYIGWTCICDVRDKKRTSVEVDEESVLEFKHKGIFHLWFLNIETDEKHLWIVTYEEGYESYTDSTQS